MTPEQEAAATRSLPSDLKADIELYIGLGTHQSNPQSSASRAITPPKCLDCAASWPDQTPLQFLFGIASDGKVLYVKILNAPNPNVEKEALKAARKWHFEAGRDEAGNQIELPLKLTVGSPRPQ